MSSKKIQWEPYKLPSKQANNFDNDGEENLPKILDTPFGYFRVDDTMNPMKQFQCAIANTNFPITKKIKTIINKIDGVEVLVIISRYKFIIGIGKLFDIQTVQKTIEKIICNENKTVISIDDNVIKRINKLKINLNKIYPIWSIYMFPNGNLDFEIRTEEINKGIFPQLPKISGGILIESKEINK